MRSYWLLIAVSCSNASSYSKAVNPILFDLFRPYLKKSIEKDIRRSFQIDGKKSGSNNRIMQIATNSKINLSLVIENCEIQNLFHLLEIIEICRIRFLDTCQSDDICNDRAK